MADKLFLVTIETEIAVLASSEDDAVRIAERYHRDLYPWEFARSAREISDVKYVDSEILDSPPFQADQGSDTTVREMLEKS